MRYWRMIPVLIVLGLLLAGIYGCQEDIVGPPPQESSPYIFPATADALLKNFVAAYSGLDLEAYGQVLHEDFLFSFQACDVQKWGLSTDHYTREEELATAAKMFSRKPVVNSRGQTQPAITAIRFVEWEQVGPWETVANDRHEGALKGSFQGMVILQREGHTNLIIRGLNVFYAVPSRIPGTDGRLRDGYQLLGWVDLTKGCLE